MAIQALTAEQKNTVEEMKALAQEGDINISNLRQMYTAKYGRPSNLGEDEICTCCASQDDAYGDDDIVRRMHAIMTGKPLVWEGEQPE